jgi:tubulin-specific chaperone D
VAELAKRGLLLPYRLEHLVPLLLKALVYDEMKGYMSVGQNIRDSACYVCWAFARAYDPRDLQPFVQRIATGLLIVTVFDREINCRRAASAAFQESVGRLGNFPHGIDILTAADFYSVGMRTNSYLIISDFIAKHEEYTIPLIDHLVELKTGHWDISIRELTAKALHKLTHHNPEYMAKSVLNKLFEKTESIDVNLRHGVILAIGEIILALTNLDVKLISDELLQQLNGVIIKFQTREQFRGMSGELMKMAALEMIKNCSTAKVSITKECIDSWQSLIDSCIVSKTSRIRELGVVALASFCEHYYSGSGETAEILKNYLIGSNNDLEEHVRMGYVLAIGSLPTFMLLSSIDEVIDKLIDHSLVPEESEIKASGLNPIILNWSESRRDSVKAIGNIVSTVGFEKLSQEHLKKIFDCLIKALEEYTTDNRGDIGAWVREASMSVLHQMLLSCPHERLGSDVVHNVMSGLAQQSVEKIDRTRGMAGKLFHSLVHHQPAIPHIQRHDILMEIFPTDGVKILWLFADHTFPLFCSMLKLPEYSEKLLTGLVGSIGQLTESLIKYASSSFLDFLKANDDEIPKICDLIVKIFRDNLLNERITYPMLNFLEMILSSGVLVMILDDESSNFADEVFRLVNLEIKGHKKLYKIVSSVNVMCQLIQVSFAD